MNFLNKCSNLTIQSTNMTEYIFCPTGGTLEDIENFIDAFKDNKSYVCTGGSLTKVKENFDFSNLDEFDEKKFKRVKLFLELDTGNHIILFGEFDLSPSTLTAIKNEFMGKKYGGFTVVNILIDKGEKVSLGG